MGASTMCSTEPSRIGLRLIPAARETMVPRVTNAKGGKQKPR